MVVTMDLADRSQLFSPAGTSRFSQREVELMKAAIYNVFETALVPYCLAAWCESDLAYHTLQRRFAIDNMPRTQVIPPIAGEELSPVINSSPKPEKQYYQFVLSPDLDMAKLTLRELTSSDLSSPDITFELAKLRFLNHVESLLNIVGLSTSEVQYLCLRPLDTDQAIFQLIEELFTDIAEQSISSEQARQVKIEAVRNYIIENYADSNLCLAMICDQFQMNQSYLFRAFKEAFGIGILDFIHSQRLLHAKELLKGPANQIDMIWDAVGYTNRSTFNRSFRT